MITDNVIGGLLQAANTASSLWNSVSSYLMPASFRGIPFAVLSVEGRFGRRNAVHEYPFRDSIWVEDLGRSARRIHVTGFLVENGAVTPGRVSDQRNRMIVAAERSGQTQVTLPTYGSMAVSLIDFHCSERWDLGRVVEISFVFAEAGSRVFPRVAISTAGAVAGAADGVDRAAAASWMDKVTAHLGTGIYAVAQGTGVLNMFSNLASTVSRGATNLFNTAVSMSGPLGRFIKGGGASTLAELSALAAVGRTLVSKAISTASASSSALSQQTASGHPVTIQAIAKAVRASCPSPGYAITALAKMAISSGSSAVAQATADLTRRSAVTEMAAASASYAPTSNNDASAVMSFVAGYLDTEILVAGDQGEDDVYQALRTLRSAVINDLTGRGASLADLVTVSSNHPMPSLTIAQRIYRDPTRDDELIEKANPIHPLFMPTSFKALSQ